MTVDGKNLGSNQYSSSIRKALESYELLPMVSHISILTLLPEADLNHFSTDQKHLLEICHAVPSGDSLFSLKISR